MSVRIRMCMMVLAIGLARAALAQAPAATEPDPRAWQVSEGKVPLTGAVLISAVLPSTEPLINMIGRPERAGLVLRCREGVLAAYVAWPEVLPVSMTTLGGRAQTMVLWRLDQAPIAVNFWIRDDAGTATGMFETKGATKLMEKLITARTLVIRLTGQTTQDAVFELGDIAAIAAKVGAPCGVSWRMPK